MKKIILIMAAVCLVCQAIPAPLCAQGLTLNQDYVSRFLEDFPAFVKMIDSHRGLKGENISDYLTAQMVSREIVDFLKKRGWEPETFSLVSSQILKAYGAIQYEAAKKEGAVDMAEAQKQMEAAMNDPSLTPEMKAMMKQSMAMAQQQMQSDPFQDVPQADKDAIQPFVPQIGSMLDDLSLEQ